MIIIDPPRTRQDLIQRLDLDPSKVPEFSISDVMNFERMGQQTIDPGTAIAKTIDDFGNNQKFKIYTNIENAEEAEEIAQILQLAKVTRNPALYQMVQDELILRPSIRAWRMTQVIQMVSNIRNQLSGGLFSGVGNTLSAIRQRGW